MQGAEQMPAHPAPMEGQGAYNRNSRVQAAGLSPALPLLEEAARIVPLGSEREPLLVADYGCSEGRNSLLPLGTAVRLLRERAGSERAISVVHNDLADNDFAALFDLLESDPESYLRDDQNVYALAAGRSFFEHVLPPDSVTLGWSSWSIQWLSRAPAEIPDQVQAAYSRDAAACAAFAQRAAQDWIAFLRARSRELRVGGRLVVLGMASDDDGAFGYRPVVEAIYAALLELVSAGFLTEAEVRRMVIPTYARTRAELLAPFGPSGRFDDLVVENIDIFFGDDRIWIETGEGRDAEAFGARWAAFSRASVFPSLALGLAGGGSDLRRTEFFARMEAAMTQALAAKPEQSLIPLAKLTLARV